MKTDRILVGALAAGVMGVLSSYATVLEVNVPADTTQTNFTEEQLTAIQSLTAADEIHKTGGGALKITSLNKIGDFTGTLRISDGCYVLSGTGIREYNSRRSALGVAGTAQVIVESGATLYSDVYTEDKTNGYWGVKIHLNGSGYTGQAGALVLGGRWGGHSTYNGFYPVMDVVLDGPTTVAKGQDPGFFNRGTKFDMNGYDLTVVNNPGLKGVTSVVNPGKIVKGEYQFDFTSNGVVEAEVYIAEGVVQTNMTAEQLAAVQAAVWTDTRGGYRKTGKGFLHVHNGNGLGSTTISGVRICDGVFIECNSNGGPFGSSGSSCTAVVEDGATLYFNHYCNTDSRIDGLTVHLAGAGYPGIGGALVLGGNWEGDTEWHGIYPYGWKVILDADATIHRGYSNGYLGYKAGQLSTLDLQGHTLTVDNTRTPVKDVGEGFDLRGVGEIRNPGKIVFNGNKYVRLGPIDWQGAGELVLSNGAATVVFTTPGGDYGAGWKLRLYETMPYSAETMKWRGSWEIAEGKSITFGTAADQELWLTNGISGGGNVALNASDTNGRIYLGGANTYAGTTTFSTGSLILLGKSAIPGGYSIAKLAGRTEVQRPIAFAKKSAACPDGWTGAEVWELVKSFRYKDDGSNRSWTIGTYSVDDFDIPCDFTETVGGSSCANMGANRTDLPGVTFQTFGGGRAVIRGVYPTGEKSFTPFRVGNGATLGYYATSNLVYSAPAGTIGQIDSTSMSFGATDITLENVYWYTRDWVYWYQTGVKSNGYDTPTRLTVGPGACTDCIRANGGRALYACGDQSGAAAVIELKEGGIISNSIWIASCETSNRQNQVGAYIQRGGEMQYHLPSKVANGLSIGGSPHGSLGYAEINAGLFIYKPADANMALTVGNWVGSTATLRQKGGTFYAKDGYWGRGGDAEMRFSGGTAHVASAMRAPRQGGNSGNTNGWASLVFDGTTHFVVSNDVQLAHRGVSTGLVTIAGSALLEANDVRKYSSADGRYAAVSFRGGTLSARQTGKLFGDAAAETVPDDVVVFAEGAKLDAPAGVEATVDTALKAPTGSGIASIAMPQGSRRHAAAPFIRITGDGQGATASAIYDSETMTVTGVEVTNPGWGYTEATAEMFFGGAVTNWPLKVTLAADAGTGGLTKTGAGTVKLMAANTYGGDTVVAGGKLVLGAAGALPEGSNLIFGEGASLESSAAAWGSRAALEVTIPESNITQRKSFTIVTFTDSAPATVPEVTLTNDFGDDASLWKVAMSGTQLRAVCCRGTTLLFR